MKKEGVNIAKEIFIIIVLSILIMLILAVALYDFIPNDIHVSEPIEYSADTKTTTVKQEIAYTNGGDTSADQSMSDQEMVTSLKSYSIEAADLNVYGQKNLYNRGNSNPFDYAEEAPTQTTEQPATNQTTNAGEVQNTNTTQDQTQTNNTSNTTNSNVGTFFENPTSK